MNIKEKTECFTKILKPYLVGESTGEEKSFFRGRNFNMFLNDIQIYEQTYKDVYFDLSANLLKKVSPNFIDLVNGLLKDIKNIKEFKIIKKLIVKPSFNDKYQDGVFEVLLNSIDDNKILFFRFSYKIRTGEYIFFLQIEDEPNLNLDYQKQKIVDLISSLSPLKKKELPKLFMQIMSEL